MIDKIRLFFAKNKRTQWAIFVLFATSVFLQCVVFQILCFHTISISSLWKNPVAFWAFWLPKLSVSLFIASFVWFSKRYDWTIVVSALIDIWAIANLTYYRANNLLLVSESIGLASNLSGFESSVGFYMSGAMLLFPLITVFLIVIYIFDWKQQRQLRIGAVMLFVSLVLSVGGGCALWKSYDKQDATDAFYWYSENAEADVILPFVGVNLAQNRESEYTKEHSVVSYAYIVAIQGLKNRRSANIALDEVEPILIERGSLKRQSMQMIVPKYNLVLILVESLESWAIEMKDANGKLVMPNLNKLTSLCFYADKVCSQVRHGVSADGQLMINTGIMPMQSGVAVMRYPNNTYPNLAHFYPESAVINPAKGTWNKSAMSKEYGYKELIEPNEDEIVEGSIFANSWNDEKLFLKAAETVEQCSAPYCMMILTLDSHSPFDRVKRSSLSFPTDMPPVMQRYLTCLHYTDSCIGEFCKKLDYENTVLLITGDHTIFKDNVLTDLLPFAQNNHLSFANGRNYVPLILFSPELPSYSLTSECQQMDIFPTVLKQIGCEDYFWKGFGIDITDSTAVRCYSENEAYKLSDDIIKGNYFEKINVQ